MKPTTNVKFTKKSAHLLCAAFQVCKQSCPRPLKSLINQETLSPKLLAKLKEQRYSYCVISRYFTLRHLGRLLTPFITKFCFRATAFMQQRPEVTSEFGLGVVGRDGETMELVKTGTQCKQTVIPYPISGVETLEDRNRCK